MYMYMYIYVCIYICVYDTYSMCDVHTHIYIYIYIYIYIFSHLPKGGRAHSPLIDVPSICSSDYAPCPTYYNCTHGSFYFVLMKGN